MNVAITCWAALGVGMRLLFYVAQVVLLFPRLTKARRRNQIQSWARTLLKRLDMELKISGAPPQQGPLLLVSNHMSWVDILALHATCQCRFVAKADVKRWPLLGTLATGGGTLYVQRESRRDAMRVVRQMAEALQNGDILAIFPEGTTSDGESVLPFHSNLIQAAIAANAPVQTVAVGFVDARSGRPSHAISYMGDESLAGSIWRTLRARGVCAVLEFGTTQRAAERDRRAWAKDLREEIIAMRRGAVLASHQTGFCISRPKIGTMR
jgi:1-acyl-sn-glycerol-3-phosphate acyltransferase